jgi:hypothetical protein
MEGLDVTLVPDCRICRRIFRLARMGQLRSPNDGTARWGRRQSIPRRVTGSDQRKMAPTSAMPPKQLPGPFCNKAPVSAEEPPSRRQLAIRNLLTIVLEANDE